MAIIGMSSKAHSNRSFGSGIHKACTGPRATTWNTHGLRDRLGGRSFKPCALFFFWQGVGFGAMASPSSVCLGSRSVCSCCCFLLPSLYAFLVLPPGWCSLFCLCLFVGALRLFFLRVVLLPLAVAYVVVFFCAVVMYVCDVCGCSLARFA